MTDRTARWWAVVLEKGGLLIATFGPFRSEDKANAWANVYHGRVIPMLPPDIDNEQTYTATRRAYDPGPGQRG
jgi:hypothetical protein